jgi:hypothetical protein
MAYPSATDPPLPFCSVESEQDTPAMALRHGMLAAGRFLPWTISRQFDLDPMAVNRRYLFVGLLAKETLETQEIEPAVLYAFTGVCFSISKAYFPLV